MRLDWTHTGGESLQYALSHVKTGAPFLERVRVLFDMAVHQKRNAKMLHQIRCERDLRLREESDYRKERPEPFQQSALKSGEYPYRHAVGDSDFFRPLIEHISAKPQK
jgi:hypothetical protein